MTCRTSSYKLLVFVHLNSEITIVVGNYDSLFKFLMKPIQSKIYSFAITVLLMAACSSYERDKQIKADLTVKAKEDINFAGLKFTVQDRYVHIWGICPTERAKTEVIRKLAAIHVIKGINAKLVIAPLKIDTNFVLKQRMDSLLARHPGLWSELSGQRIIIKGRIKDKQLPQLLNSIHQAIPNRLLINQTLTN
jgi:hypothetical protein